MYVVVDHRMSIAESYASAFSREGFASQCFSDDEFKDWISTAPDADLDAVQSFLIGDCEARAALPRMIRPRSRAPIIALEDVKSLSRTLELFTAGIDDVVCKPVHVREIIARSHAVWRHGRDAGGPAGTHGRLAVYLDGRDPEVDGEALPLPRRERHLLEYLVQHRDRRVTKTQIFNAIYGLFNDDLDESVIESHMSRLRKKLRLRLGHDVIDAQRHLGYRFIGCPPEQKGPATRRGRATHVSDLAAA